MLEGKNIIVGITGSIAAYKAAYFIRLLKTAGANVKIIMTPRGKEFITPLTVATLSKNPILTDFYNPENGDWNSHVSLGLWADAYVIAPATANTIAKMANGIADNLLLTTYLSARCPVFVAPAMDVDMYNHPSTQKNIQTLKSFGNIFIEPQDGELASGLVGKGRLAEPDDILIKINDFFSAKQLLVGKKILVTAGPTYEKIDAVRFVGNYSSGKMGYEIAEECANRGAEVILISGPVKITIKNPKITVIKVESAAEMYNSCIENFGKCDIAILSAAVSDFTPKKPSFDKLKRNENNLELVLTPTKDIAAKLGEIKKNNQILIGFALEKSNEEKNASDKLKKKNLDFIVLNSLNDEGAGFNSDTNKITIIDKNGEISNYELKPKSEVAKDIVDKISFLPA